MKKLSERKKTVLCTNIDAISHKTLMLIEKTEFGTQAYEDALRIRELAKLVKEQALAMEKRLYLYKETIEGLGFKRVRSSK